MRATHDLRALQPCERAAPVLGPFPVRCKSQNTCTMTHFRLGGKGEQLSVRTF